MSLSKPQPKMIQLSAVLSIAALLFLGFPGLLNAATIDLAGPHLVNLDEDNPEFTLLDYDDSGWTTIEVPQSLREAGLDPRPDVYWYRIKFHLPSKLERAVTRLAARYY